MIYEIPVFSPTIIVPDTLLPLEVQETAKLSKTPLPRRRIVAIVARLLHATSLDHPVCESRTGIHPIVFTKHIGLYNIPNPAQQVFEERLVGAYSSFKASPCTISTQINPTLVYKDSQPCKRSTRNG